MPAHRVGGEVDGWCTRCKMVLAHTIVALVGPRIAKARCNTCMGEHAWRSGPPGEGEPVRRRSGDEEPAPKRTVTIPYEEKIAGRDQSQAKPYTVHSVFAVDDLIRHPNFGLGIVTQVKGPQKIEVMFSQDVKVLMHDKDSARPLAHALPRPAEPVPADEPKAANRFPDSNPNPFPDSNPSGRGGPATA